jgi:Nitroreductase
MKKVSFILTALLFAVSLSAQQLSPIKLNAPNKNRGEVIMKALDNRKSTSDYTEQTLSLQDMSDLFWAAHGINRPEEGKRTTGSAMNRQDVMVYAFTTEGAYIYDAKAHELQPVATGDHRKLFGERSMTPMIILLVSDVAKFGEVGSPELRKEWGAIDVGLVSQNIALFCSGVGLGTKPRASMDREGIKALLNLTDLQLPMLNHAIGHIK